MASQVVILGTTVTLPDPASVTALARSFRNVGEYLTGLQDTLQTLSTPGAWGEWTGEAADAFGQSIGQLPADVANVAHAYGQVAMALQEYASELEPVVGALRALAFQADDADHALILTQRTRDQVIAQGQDPVATGWDARLADATAAVSVLHGQLTRELNELDTLSGRCAGQITAAKPGKPGKSLFGSLANDFRKDLVDPVEHAATDVGRGYVGLVENEWQAAQEIARGAVEAGRIGASVVDALYIHPFTDLGPALAAFARKPSAENLGRLLGDTAGVVGIIAPEAGILAEAGLVAKAGLAVKAGSIAAKAGLAVGGGAAVAEGWAAHEHEGGASYGSAALAAAGPILGYGAGKLGEGLTVAKDAEAATAAAEAADLPDGADALAAGDALPGTGTRQAISLPDPDQGVPSTSSDTAVPPSDTAVPPSDPAAPSDPAPAAGQEPSRLRSLLSAQSGSVSDQVNEYLHFGGDGQPHTPEVAALQHQKFVVEQAEHVVDVDHDVKDHAKDEGSQPSGGWIS
jgi:uncharacterized protein YukE